MLIALVLILVQTSLAQEVPVYQHSQLVLEGLELARENRFSESIDKFNLALDQDSSNGTICLYLANTHLQLSNFDQAEIHCKRARRFLQTPEVYATMAQIKYRKGQLEKAREQYQKAIELDPNVAYYHNELAQIHHSLGFLNLAEVGYKNTIKISPKVPSAYHNLGEIYHLQGKIEQAIIAYQKSLSVATSPKSTASLATKKRLQEALEKKQELIGKEILRCQLAVASKKNSATAYRQLALAYYAGRHLQEAIRSIEAAKELAPESLQIRQDFLTLEQQKQSSLKAILGNLRDELKKDPKKSDLLYDIGLVCVNLEQLKEAKSYFQSALEISPQEACIWLQIGLLQKKLNQKELAQEAFLNSIKYDPTIWEAYFNLALSELESGCKSSAQEYLLKAKSILDNELYRNDVHSSVPVRFALSEVNFSLGEVYTHLNQITEAIDAYHISVRLKPDVPDPYFGLAKLYSQAGNQTAAASFYDRFLNLARPRQKWKAKVVQSENQFLQILSSEQADK